MRPRSDRFGKLGLGQLGSLGLASSGPVAGGGYSDEALAFFARITNQPTAQRKRALDNFFRAIPDILAKEEAWLFASADGQTSLLDLRAAAFNATPVGGPNFQPDVGWKGIAAVADYIRLAYRPGLDGLSGQNNNYLAVWALTDTATGTVEVGNTNNTISVNNSSGNLTVRAMRAATSTIALPQGLGLFSVQRSSSTEFTVSWNGVQQGAPVAAVSEAPANAELYALGRNNAGALATSSDRRLAVIVAGAYLDATEQLRLYNALNTYLTAIGALTATEWPLARTLTASSIPTLPDGASAVPGMGFSGTGDAVDPSDNSLWCGHGRGLPAVLRSGIVHLSADGVTILSETFADDLGLPAGSSGQGVAFDTSDSSQWWVNKNSAATTYLVHTKNGALVLGTGAMALGYMALPARMNALTINNNTGELYLALDNTSDIYRYSKDGTQLGILFTAPAVMDQMWFDDVRQQLLATVPGAGSLDGRLYQFDYDPIAGWTWHYNNLMTDTPSIEGATRQGSRIAVMNDGGTHSTGTNKNQIMFFDEPA